MKTNVFLKWTAPESAGRFFPRSAQLRSAVAQGCALPLLRKHQGARSFGNQAMPTTSRRYGRVQLCATAFTLIEIMVVVVVIGILAAVIVPQFTTTKHDARVSAAKGHIAELEAALERFNVHMDRYPTSDEGLKVLIEPPVSEDKKWRGPYIAQLRSDPWGNPYQYRCPGQHNATRFDLWSRGGDGADGGEGDAADIGNWQ